MRRVLIICSVVIVALVGGAIWWTGRDTAPPPMSVDDVGSSASTDGSTSGATADLDGRWTVVAGPDSQAGLRIVEDRFGGLGDNTAVGRTNDVTGGLELDGTTVASGSFTVDLSAIEFTDDPGIPVANRSEYLRTKTLETDRFPDASFELTEPVSLSSLPKAGQTVTASATGSLTIHGVARTKTFDVQAKRVGDTVVLATAKPVEVKLADHDIEAPSISGISEVRDTGEFEFLVVLRQA